MFCRVSQPCCRRRATDVGGCQWNATSHAPEHVRNDGIVRSFISNVIDSDGNSSALPSEFKRSSDSHVVTRLIGIVSTVHPSTTRRDPMVTDSEHRVLATETFTPTPEFLKCSDLFATCEHSSHRRIDTEQCDDVTARRHLLDATVVKLRRTASIPVRTSHCTTQRSEPAFVPGDQGHPISTLSILHRRGGIDGDIDPDDRNHSDVSSSTNEPHRTRKSIAIRQCHVGHIRSRRRNCESLRGDRCITQREGRPGTQVRETHRPCRRVHQSQTRSSRQPLAR